MEETINTWVRENKQIFAKNLIEKLKITPRKTPLAFFMAGLPGAGKTEFSKNILLTLGATDILRLDMDEIAEQIPGYTPKQADLFRAGASTLLNRTFDLALKNKISFLMDGTFSSNSALKNVERAHNAGYRIEIIYIMQDPKIAWTFTKRREKIEHRSISIEGFIKSYFDTPKNIINVMEQKYDKINIDIIRKGENNEILAQPESVSLEKMQKIDKQEINCYNKKTLQEYLND